MFRKSCSIFSKWNKLLPGETNIHCLLDIVSSTFKSFDPITIKSMTNHNGSELEIEETTLKKGAMMYRAINHPLRQNMLHHLHVNGRMTVTQLYNLLQLEQSVTSQHLAILRDQDLIVPERAGKFIYYSINYGRLDFLHELTNAFLSRNKGVE